MTRARLVDPLLALLVFVIAITVYLSGRDVITITDSRWALYVAESLMRSGDLNLDEYAHLMRPGDEYTITRAGGHIYSYFPIGAPLAAAPYMAVLDRLAPSLWGIDLYAYLQQAKFDAFVAQLELTWACVIASAAAAIVYLSARQELVRWRSLLLAAIFAFGTAVWSTASRRAVAARTLPVAAGAGAISGAARPTRCAQHTLCQCDSHACLYRAAYQCHCTRCVHRLCCARLSAAACRVPVGGSDCRRAFRAI